MTRQPGPWAQGPVIRGKVVTVGMPVQDILVDSLDMQCGSGPSATRTGGTGTRRSLGHSLREEVGNRRPRRVDFRSPPETGNPALR